MNMDTINTFGLILALTILNMTLKYFMFDYEIMFESVCGNNLYLAMRVKWLAQIIQESIH